MKNKKGFVISIEAMISLLVLILVLLSLPQENNTSLKELLITQQENDLLRVWASEQPLINQNDLINDSKKYSEKISPFILMGKKFMETKSIYKKKKIVFRAKEQS